MNNNNSKTNTSYRFRHYCRGAYAVFNSLHREITIGHLATYIANRQWQKSLPALAIALLLLQGHAMAQTDNTPEEHMLPAVEIAASSDTLFATPDPAAIITAYDLAQTPITHISDILALLPGLDIRSRGAADVQADLSMHGGTFDQMVVMLNGINLTDAQTGHHTLNLPIDISMVERIELLTPSQALARGVVAFCGAVNIIVCEQYRDQLVAQISAGTHATSQASLLATKQLGPWALTVATAYNRSDGYMPNTDYRYGTLYLQATRHAATSDWHLQLGGQGKGFGSQAFYSTTYPDQFEATRTATAAITHIAHLRHLRIATSLYGRLHRDRFELFRDGYATSPSWYTGHNHHLSSTSGLRTIAATRLGHGEALAGLELRREGIVSNVLGLPLDAPTTLLGHTYPKATARIQASLFAGYRLTWHRLTAETYLLGLHNTAFGNHYAATADIGYRATDNLRLRASLSRTFRLPTFTDLYYESPTQIANPDLNSEHSLNASVGATYTPRRWIVDLDAYHHAGSQIIDWVRRPDEEVWYSMNHTYVDASGIDLTFRYHVGGFVNTIGGCYSFCHLEQNAGQYISGSAIDYLRHKANLHMGFAPTSRWHLNINLNYRHREGTYTSSDGTQQPYTDALLVDASTEYRLGVITLFAEGYNLANCHYRDYGGVPQPGRTFMIGVRYGNRPTR